MAGLTSRNDLHICRHRSFWDFVNDPAVPFFYVPGYREWGIGTISTDTVANDWWRTASIEISRFCPWCGVEFPSSLRAERRKRLDKLKQDPAVVGVPEAYMSDQWWRDAGL